MPKNNGIPCVVAAIVMTVTIAFADLFPVREGNWWRFTYAMTFGGLEGGLQIDSGTVQWRIIRIIVSKNDTAGKDAYLIKIQQRRDLTRSRTTIITNPIIVKDSLFNPPRGAIDTLILTRDSIQPTGSHLYLWNGIKLNKDSCVTLLHEPLCPADQCTLSTSQVLYKGTTITGYMVDPFPCRKKGTLAPNCIAPKRFTLADGIGPVAYELGLEPCIFDLNINEQWTLIDHHASNRWIEPDTITAGELATLTLSTLEYSCFPDSFDKNAEIASNGVSLVYKPVYNPAADCLPRYGVSASITYQFTAPAPGKYPVFIESQPPCAPLCKMASIIECIDTLVVMGASAIKGHTKPFSPVTIPSVQSKNGVVTLNNAHRYNGGEACLLDASGRLLNHASIREGKAIFKSRKYVMGKVLFVAIDNQTTLRCLIR